MHVDDAQVQPRDRAHGAGDGVRDVVKLQVEEDRHTQIDNSLHAIRAVSREKLQPGLHSADMAAQRFGPGQGLVEIGGVEGDKDGIGGECGAIGHGPPLLPEPRRAAKAKSHASDLIPSRTRSTSVSAKNR